MRYSFALFAAVVAAAPQASVYPISQISDGQIQAPPATSAPAVAPSSVPGYGASTPVVVPSVSVPRVSSVPVISSKPSVTPVVPVVPSNTPVVPSSLVTPIVPGVNSTIPSSTGAIRSPSGPSAPASATTSGIPQSTGAAGSNLVSLGGLVFAIGAAVFA